MKFKKLHNLLFVAILAIFSMQLIGLSVLFFLPVKEVSAQNYTPINLDTPTPTPGGTIFTPQVDIPGSEFTRGAKIVPDGLMIANYIQAWYKFAVAGVGILAVVMIMAGGLIWLTAGGKADQVSTAKDWIMGAVMGLVLALMSYTLLDILNPNLVTFQSLDLPEIKLVESGLCCIPNKGVADEKETKECTKYGGTMCTLLQACRMDEVDGTEQYVCTNVKKGENCGDASDCPEGWFCVGGGCYNGGAGATCDISMKSCADNFYCIDAPGWIYGYRCFDGKEGDVCDPEENNQCNKPLTCQAGGWKKIWFGYACKSPL